MTLQHLRSSTANKRPLPGSMSDGQIAINTNTSSPGLFFKDSAGVLVKVGPVHVGSTAPNVSPASGGETGNTVGEQWLDTSGSTYVFKIWDGSAWRSEAGEFVNVTGDVMTGALGIIAGSAGSPGLYVSGDTNTGIYSPGADQVAISTNGAGRLQIDSNGIVRTGSAVGTYGGASVLYPTANGVVDVASNVANVPGVIKLGNAGFSNTAEYATGAVEFRGFDSVGNTMGYASVEGLVSDATAATRKGTIVFKTINSSTVSEKMRLTAEGRLGLGTSSPSSLLDISNGGTALSASGGTLARIIGSGTSRLDVVAGNSSYSIIEFSRANLTAASQIAYEHSSNSLYFTTNGTTERARLDSSGRLLVGTSSSTGAARAVFQGNSFSSGQPGIILIQRDTSSSGLTAGAAMGYIIFGDNVGSNYAVIGCEADGATGTNDYPSRLVFSTTADGASSPTERMRIKSNGQIDFGNTTNGAYTVTRNTGVVAYFDRRGTDGTIIQFEQDGTSEGSISVSGTTVSYNGAHLSRWSQLPGGTERTEILRGTVLSNIDEMCAWGEEDNEQLNRMKVSDVEGDPNVAGVFQGWDDDDDTYTDDFYCAMTGDFIIRIAEGVTVQRGDLLMSAGDGTAKPQDDDIIRSKTIAKVTSTHVTCTYDNGSYCVPCVLMAC